MQAARAPYTLGVGGTLDASKPSPPRSLENPVKQKTIDSHAHKGKSHASAAPRRGRKPPPKRAATDLERALSAKIAGLLKGNLTPRKLRMVAEFATSGEHILMLEARAASGAITLGRRRRGEMLNSMNMGPPFFPTEADHPEDSGDADDGLPAAPWATRLLREGISALTETFHRAPRAEVDPEKLVRSIVAAREAGLTEIVAKLEQQIGIDRPGDAPSTDATLAKAPATAPRSAPRRKAAAS